MITMFLAIGALMAGLAFESEAATPPSGVKTATVAWRGGYRYRRYSSPSTSSDAYSRGSYGRTSALDYPSSTQPWASRMHQWNKYPNQPYYLRGERKSLGILP
jgi:hypothetical protein